MWDNRYATEDYRFGTTPNRFLEECAPLLTSGAKMPVPAVRVLSLGEGEGRNAVYLAGLGFDVTAVDGSAVGLTKARTLASQRGVTLTTITADLNDYPIPPAAWDCIINFFCHMTKPERVPLHRRVIDGLKPGGAYILEVFSPQQPQFGTGGPTSRDLLMSADDARRELAGLDLRIVREVVRHRDDDDPSTSLVAVTQVFGIRT